MLIDQTGQLSMVSFKHAFALFTFSFLLCANLQIAAAQDQDKDTVVIQLGDEKYTVAYASTHINRQLGLMYRRQMCEDCGMLFKFDSVRIASIWMKNTYIPLDLAYISEEGEIVSIHQLTPHDETSVPSPKRVLYALEMNQGWFAKKDIRPGDKVGLLP